MQMVSSEGLFHGKQISIILQTKTSMTSCGHTTQHRENASGFTHPWKPSLNQWVLHLKFESSNYCCLLGHA